MTTVQSNTNKELSSRNPNRKNRQITKVKVQTIQNVLYEIDLINKDTTGLRVKGQQQQFNKFNKYRPYSSSSNTSKNTDQQSLSIDSYYNQQYFKGRIQVPWLFLINQDGVYNKITNYLDGLVPYAKTYEQVKKYFIASNAQYKVVVDIKSINQLLNDENITKKITEIFVYDNSLTTDKHSKQSIEQVRKKLGIKFKSVFVSIDFFLKQIKVQNQKYDHFINTIEVNLTSNQTHESYPTIVNLSQANLPVELMNFRSNLWTALAMNNQTIQRNSSQTPSKYFMNLFQQFTQRFFYKNNKILSQINHYFDQINPGNFNPDKQNQMTNILLFNYQNTFFQRFTTNMLKLYEKFPQEKAVIFPFAKLYTAIKYFYDKLSIQKENNCQFIDVYCLMKLQDVKNMNQGYVIQNVGFIYCSRNRDQIERKVIKNVSVMTKIRIETNRVLSNDMDDRVFDHGFVDYQHKQIQSLFNSLQSKIEQSISNQVVINAFNLFRVKKVDISNSNNNQSQTLYLQYITLPQLLQNQFHINNHLNLQKLSPQSISSNSPTSILTNNLKTLKQQILNKFDIADFYHFINDREKQIQQRKYQFITLNNNSQKNIIKIIQIIQNTSNENNSIIDSQQILKSICTTLIQCNNSQFKNKSQLRTLMKQVLIKNEDLINVQKIINKQLNILKQEFKKSQSTNSSQQKDNILIQLTQTLNQSGHNLIDMGKYYQAQSVYKECIQIIEEQLNLCDKSNKSQKLSAFCCSWFKRLFSNHQRHKIIQNVIGQQNQKQLNQLKFVKFFKHIISSIISLLKTYKIIQNDKQKKEYIQKGHKYIEIMNKIKLTNEKQQTSIIDQKLLQLKFIIQTQNLPTITDNKSNNYNNNLQQLRKQLQSKEQKSLQLANFYQSLGQLKKLYIKNMLRQKRQTQNNNISNDSNINQIITQSQIIQKDQNTFNYQQYQQLLVSAISYYKMSIDIKIQLFSQNSSQVFKTKNQLAELLIQNKKSSEAKQILTNLLKSPLAENHSQGSRSQYLLAKISYQLGLYKHSFEKLNCAFNIIKKSTLKQNQKQYQQVLKKSPIFRKIQLLRASIYNQQQRYDLSLRSLQFLQSIPCDSEHMVKILQMKGNTYALRKGSGDQKRFLNEFEKAIQLLKKDNDGINMEIGLIYCSIAKFYVKYQKIQNAQNYLKKAREIFDHFPSDHPNMWVYYFIKSLLLAKQSQDVTDKNSYDYIKSIKESIKLAQKAVSSCKEKYGQRHIVYVKVRIHYAKLLKKQYEILSQNYCEQVLDNIKKTFQQIKQILVEMNNQDIKQTDYNLKVDSQVQLNQLVRQKYPHKDDLHKEIIESVHHEYSASASETNNQHGSDETQQLSSQTEKKLIKRQDNTSQMMSQIMNRTQSNNNITSQKLLFNKDQCRLRFQQQLVQDVKDMRV